MDGVDVIVLGAAVALGLALVAVFDGWGVVVAALLSVAVVWVRRSRR